MGSKDSVYINNWFVSYNGDLSLNSYYQIFDGFRFIWYKNGEEYWMALGDRPMLVYCESDLT